jgi:hypothetical protein
MLRVMAAIGSSVVRMTGEIAHRLQWEIGREGGLVVPREEAEQP